MTRVLMVSTISRFLRDFLLPYARHFRAQGWQVDALTNGVGVYPECQQAFDHLWEIEWSRNPFDVHNLMSAPARVRELVAREQYDIVHVHTPIAAFVTRYALRTKIRNRRPALIYTAHGFHFQEGRHTVQNLLFLAMEKWASQWTDYLVVMNHEDEVAAQRYALVRPEHIRYMPGIGVDLAYYTRRSVSLLEVRRIRHEIGNSGDTPFLLMVAEFIPRKRHLDALRAFAQLADKSVHLAFAGEGPLLAYIRQQANKVGVQHRVHFLGYRQDIPALMCAARALLLPSAQEGLPRAIMESLALGTPVIGTDIRGIRDLLATGGGLLVPLGNVRQLAAAMQWMLAHAREAAAMGQRGSIAMRDYDLCALLQGHEELYRTALGENVVGDRAAA